MTPELWKRIEEIYHTAAELDGADRDSFLARTCADDDELRRNVDSLLVENRRTSSFLERSAMEVEAEALARLKVAPGLPSLGDRYDILGELGRGGMDI